MTRRLPQFCLDRPVTALLQPLDAASSVVFRISFGIVAAWWSVDDFMTGRVEEIYAAPRFHFTYYLFDFVRPWPGVGMAWHFVGLFLLALCIAAGFLYRLTTALFAIGFTYFFLLDRTNYQNHYYLLMLMSWTLVLLPLNRCAALDVYFGLARGSDTVPAWCLWLLRFHVALPYAFGGVAKLHPDWFAGEPMRTHLNTIAWPPIIGSLFTSEVTIGIVTWVGLVFDLSIVPLLLWRRTRVLAYVMCLIFHLTNAFLFEIHIFPWFMILATTIFFSPDWPRAVLGYRSPVRSDVPAVEQTWSTLPWWSRAMGCLLVTYCIGHLLLPLRPFLYAGNSAWTERGHHFSWRMMMRSKTSALRFYLTDSQTGKTGSVDLRRFVNMTQLTSLSRDPEMILQLAHFIGNEFRKETGRDVEVRALVLTTLNGRKPELLIDPNVNLTKEPRGFYFRSWIMPQREPLRRIAWSVPMRDWERHVKIPPLNFLKQTESAAKKQTNPDIPGGQAQ